MGFMFIDLMADAFHNGQYVFDRGQLVDAIFQSAAVSIIPEPSAALLGSAGLGMLLRRRRSS